MEIYDILLTALFIVIFICVTWIWTTLTYFKSTGIPYIRGWPIVGSIGPSIFQKVQIGPLTKEYYDKWPEAKYIGFYDCMTPAIMLRDPDLIKAAAIKNFDHFTDNYGFTVESDKMFGKSVFSLQGQRWRDIRNLLSPAFTSSKLKLMYDAITRYAQDVVHQLSEEVKKGNPEVELKDVFSRFTNDVICKFSYGIDVSSVKDPQNDIYVTGRETFFFKGLLSVRMLLLKNFPRIVRLLNIKLFDKDHEEFFQNVMKDVMAARKQNGIVQQDMLQILMNAKDDPDAKTKIDMDELMAQTFIFFLAGLETTATAMSFVAHLLATNPEVQEKLQVEIDGVWKETNGNPSYEAIQNITYMENIINESGRMYTILPILSKKCTKRFELPPALPGLKPLVVEPEDYICFPVYAIHHDPKYYPNPEKFDPDRFVNNTITNTSGFFMPFGSGPRMCIGARLATMNMKVMTFYLFKTFNLKPCSKTSIPMKISPKSFTTLSENDFWVKLEFRNKT